MQQESHPKTTRVNKPQQTPFALENFENLPDSAQVRLPVVKGIFSVSGATVWRMVKAKKLNAYKLTERTTTFNVGEIRALLASKVEG